jgi:hypothetical protein
VQFIHFHPDFFYCICVIGGFLWIQNLNDKQLSPPSIFWNSDISSAIV